MLGKNSKRMVLPIASIILAVSLCLPVVLPLTGSAATQTSTAKARTAVNEKKRHTEKTSDYSIDIAYPQYNNAALDDGIQSLIDTLVDDAKKTAESGTVRNYNLIASWRSIPYNNRYITVVFEVFKDTGAANPDTTLYSLCFDVENDSFVTLPDVFQAKSNYLDRLSKESATQLAAYRTKDGSSLTWFQDGIAASEANFSCFAPTSTGLRFYFPAGQVASQADGIINITIPYSKLNGILALSVK